jgi:hypothetical protein
VGIAGPVNRGQGGILSAEHFQIAIKRLQFEIQFNPPFEKALLFRVFFDWHA